MQFIGLTEQISRNNRNSVLLLISFPLLLLAMMYAIIYFTFNHEEYNGYSKLDFVNGIFSHAVPFVLIIVGIWILIAWIGHTTFIRVATGSKPLERKENMRVYNLIENLC